MAAIDYFLCQQMQEADSQLFKEIQNEWKKKEAFLGITE